MSALPQITTCFQTDPGMVRTHNEDSCLVDEEHYCFLVADGMGGAAAGEVASKQMKEVVQELFAQRTTYSSSAELNKLVTTCFHAANTRISALAREEPSFSGMGCTAILLAFDTKGFVLGHVGDSRCYRMRQGVFEQLSKDHTLVQAQLDQGLIDQEQAKNHKLKNVLLRAIGNTEDLKVDIVCGNVQPGDLFLLCSDGLTNMVHDENIVEIISYNGDLPLKATMLVDQAKYAGGEDNISIVLIEVA